jgi:UDP-2,3-diacylglucosamine pyrophosphatase LpxH
MIGTRLLRHVVLLALACLLPAAALAQSEPYKVFDTRPVLTEGPYLVALSDTAVSVVWMTDTPCHSKVRVWQSADLARSSTAPVAFEFEPQVNGLASVGLRHVVALAGLAPGTAYTYQAVTTRVVKLKAYWPDKGLATESARANFTTFDAGTATASFSAVTDTHEDTARIGKLMKMADWATTDALVHLGDAFDWLDTEDQLFRKWLTPIVAALGPGKPLLYARGNHELRGPFARHLFDYVPTPEGRFYYARDLGPMHLLVLDTTEDKPDSTNVYADLNKTTPYRAAELAWLRDHVRTSPRMAAAPFRVVAMHQPQWGWLEGGNGPWIAAANDAKVDLVIAGHNHRFSYEAPNTTHTYHLLVLGQDQLARVDATTRELRVTVTGTDGVVVKTLTISARSPDPRQPPPGSRTASSVGDPTPRAR